MHHRRHEQGPGFAPQHQKTTVTLETLSRGLERWLSGQRRLPANMMTWVSSLASLWWLLLGRVCSRPAAEAHCRHSSSILNTLGSIHSLNKTEFAHLACNQNDLLNRPVTMTPTKKELSNSRIRLKNSQKSIANQTQKLVTKRYQLYKCKVSLTQKSNNVMHHSNKMKNKKKKSQNHLSWWR